MPNSERNSEKRNLRVSASRVDGGIEYVTFEPTRRRDKILDKVVGRVLGYTAVGVAFAIGAVVERLESRTRRNTLRSHISPF